MKKKFFCILGTLVLNLVFVGCPMDDGHDSTTDTERAAAQLAADINAIKAGSATVNGTTVKLTSGIGLGGRDGLTHTTLTVPAGVTLDLTTIDDASIMLHDATLTVNGTILTNIAHGFTPQNNPWTAPSIRLEDSANWGIINGSGTIYQKGKGSILNISGNRNVANRTLTLDGVTLVGVADNDSPLVEVRGNTEEGYTGEFIMKSGKITGNTHIDGTDWAGGGGVKVGNYGEFLMYDGIISNNRATSNNLGGLGGGVNVEDYGTFTMFGGEISDNKADHEKANARSYGGGVMVEGTFTMKGGTIKNNSAVVGGGVRSNHATGIFHLEDGLIMGNTAEERGGGVAVTDHGRFTMSGGRIQGSTTDGNYTSNAASHSSALAAGGDNETAKWGTGGTYTKGGVEQTGGSDIGSTDETLIAIPAP